MSASRDGSHLVVWKSRNWNDVYVGELEENGTRLGPPRRLTMSDTEDLANAWTPDGKAILFESNRTGRNQIFKQPLDRDTAEPLMQRAEDQQGAKVSPDGAWILYWAAAGDSKSPPASRRLMRLPTSGGIPDQVLEAPIAQQPFFDCPLRPGGSCVFSSLNQGETVFQALDPLRGPGKQLARTKALPLWSISPEGARIVFRNARGLHVIDLRNGAVRDVHPPMGIESLSWTADGNALFVTAGYSIVRIELDGRTRTLLDLARDHWPNSICASPDGRYLAFSQQTFESNIWLLQNF
jgi:Tol biopolymer transport system component